MKNSTIFFKTLLDEREKYQYKSNDVLLFSTMIPSELVQAYSFNPVYILGGTLHAKETYSDLFPRDVDKVIQSSYSLYKEYTSNYKDHVKVIILLLNDDYRKLASILNDEGAKVIMIDTLSLNHYADYENMHTQFIRQLSKELFTLSNTSIDILTLYKEIKANYHIRKKLHNLHLLSIRKNTNMSVYDYYIISNSFHTLKDKKLFLKNLTLYINGLSKGTKTRKKIGVFGSPLFYPNTKIFDILEQFDLDISIFLNELNATHIIVSSCNFNLYDLKEMYVYLAQEYFTNTMMIFAQSDNKLLNDDINKVNGLIYIVLKGQVTYDFQFDYYEKIVNIPLIKIETDYFNEDIEQIKIRLEAFKEMISQ